MADVRNRNLNTRRIGDVPYGYGTEAPKLEPRPEKVPQRKPEQKPAPRKRSQSGAGMLIFFGIITAMLLAVSVFFLSARSDITTTQNKIESLQRQLQKSRADNDAMQIYLNKSIDLSEAYKRATGDLGMVYPSDEQIIYYLRSNEGFVRQNEDIPHE